MAHLHIPDGVLPLPLWAGGWALTAILVLVASARGVPPQQVAFRAAIGALALAAMAVELPLGPFEYHLTLAAPVGVLLGVAGGFQVLCIVTAVLAFLGHGGFTVIGLNALVLGTGAATGRIAFVALRRALAAPPALAAATAAGQVCAGLLWVVFVAIAVRSVGPAAAARIPVLATVALPLWALGIALESLVAYGIARFLTRVRPDLLPGGDVRKPAGVA